MNDFTTPKQVRDALRQRFLDRLALHQCDCGHQPWHHSGHGVCSILECECSGYAHTG